MTFLPERTSRPTVATLAFVLCLLASRPASAADDEHWAYRPLTRPDIPDTGTRQWPGHVRNPIDAFVLAKLADKRLRPSAEAGRATLIRRVYFDLTGLPPEPHDVEAFVNDPDPAAYEKLVDRLLASPRYGERWARHWLDVARYADTHGYDKDKVRPNAWPYRDYVIRAFNDDKPYARFVREQLAGDFFYPDIPDGVVALGFIAAGPFDFVGQIELREGTIDKAITRNLDRDDMVASTMNTFVSTTAQCARCHDHKFDPVKQSDYYSLQAVFAAVDRADRPYDPDPRVAHERAQLTSTLRDLRDRKRHIEFKAGAELASIDARLTALAQPSPKGVRREYGYHSVIERTQDVTKWVQVDLGSPTRIARVVLVGASDSFAGIGAGFGFPVRYKIEASDDPTFSFGVATITDRTAADQPNPGSLPQNIDSDVTARYVRLTATKLAPRQNDYIFALAELSVLTSGGVNAAAGKPVSALDSTEAAPRWSERNLVDGIYPGSDDGDRGERAKLGEQRWALIARALDEPARRELNEIDSALAATTSALTALPRPAMVYAAATEFEPNGSFVPTHGKPRKVFVLKRGGEKDPGEAVGPGTVGCLPGLPSRFDLPDGADEARARAALADWIVSPKNPLTWRSIVNRVWQYHFGRGIVETPNDFGRMGAPPTHPELLDWLAAEFRDGGQSIKSFHRLILTSATYRQSSANDDACARIDEGNQYLWRANRRRLEAEAIHDSVLAVAGKLDLKTSGPGYRDFGFEDDHSPRYKYAESDPSNVATQRRAIYRFVVRSVPQPFMEALDCADPSQGVPRRNETLTPLQALAMLNDKLTVRMAEDFAKRVERECPAPDVAARVMLACRIALGRAPDDAERRVLIDAATRLGLAGACRIILNTNEFVFVD